MVPYIVNKTNDCLNCGTARIKKSLVLERKRVNVLKKKIIEKFSITSKEKNIELM